MKLVFATLATLCSIFSFFPLLFHFMEMKNCPEIIEEYYLKISPDYALLIGVLGGIFLFLFILSEIKEKKEKDESDRRFYSAYGDF